MTAARFIETDDGDMIAIDRIVRVLASTTIHHIAGRWSCSGTVHAMLLTAALSPDSGEIGSQVERHILWMGEDLAMPPGPWSAAEIERRKDGVIWEADHQARLALRRVCEAMGGVIQWDHWDEPAAEGTTPT